MILHIPVIPFRRSFASLIAMVVLSILAFPQHYTQTNLVSDGSIPGTKPDPNLVNAWGISRSSGSPWWVSDNGTRTSTLYLGDGSPVPLVITVPGAPTGTLFNGTQDFKINGSPAPFLFASEDGTISGWNGSLGTEAMVVGSKDTAIYKGLAMATAHGANYLYATDFHNGTIDVYDANLQRLVTYGIDDTDMSRQCHYYRLHGFAPFNIQNIGGSLFVTFAKQDADKEDDVPGPGNGFVAAFTPLGRLIRIYRHGPWLNSPWGMTLAPDDFGAFSHDFLVGQFGSGQIAAYNIVSGEFEGLLLDSSNHPIVINGLWGIGSAMEQMRVPTLRCSLPLVQTTKITVFSGR
jgi:uncharacterized protein (TIGR03118 family)